MKLHVKCDRCGTFAEGVQADPMYPPRLPEGWMHLRFFGDPLVINCGMPQGEPSAELCPTCTAVVGKAAKAAIDRRT